VVYVVLVTSGEMMMQSLTWKVHREVLGSAYAILRFVAAAFAGVAFLCAVYVGFRPYLKPSATTRLDEIERRLGYKWVDHKPVPLAP
jgi:hypothetical protein